MEENEAVSTNVVLDVLAGSSDGKAELDPSDQSTDLAEEAKAELDSSNEPEDSLEDKIVTKSDVDLSENTNGNCATTDSEVSKKSSDIGHVENSETAKSLQNHVTDGSQGDKEVSDNDKLGQDSIAILVNDDEKNDNKDTTMEVDGQDKSDEIKNEIEENNVEKEIENSEDIKQSNEIEESMEIEKSNKTEEIKVTEEPKETEDANELEESKEMEVSEELNESENLKEDEESKDNEDSKEEYENNMHSANVDIDEEESSSGKPEERDGKDVDPFDALLKDTSENDTESASTSRQNVTNIVAADDDDDDDHHDADDALETDHLDGEARAVQTDEPAIEEEPGAYEEVCLLPDTEREISDADKAAAAKVLAEKRKQAEELAAITLVAKEENEMEVDEPCETVNDANNDENSDRDANTASEAPPEDNADKDTEADEVRSVSNPGIINEVYPVDETCVECKKYMSCLYKLSVDNKTRHICSDICLMKFQRDHPDQYIIVDKKFVVIEIMPNKQTCSECEEHKVCYFYYNYDGEDTNYCSLKCLHSMMADEKDKYIYKRRKIPVMETDPVRGTCERCNVTKNCSFKFSRYGETHYLCTMPCLKALNDSEDNRYSFKAKKATKLTTVAPPMLKLKVISNATDKYLDEAYKIQAKTPAMIQAAKEDRERTFMRQCMQCSLVLSLDDKNLTWETMEFCNEVCLGRYQNKIGSKCTNCSGSVNHTSLGKYCVRFGYDIRQFCNSSCLEEFKKGLKICCYCQKDLSAGHQGFLAPVGDKGQFKDFCSQNCMERFDQMSKNPVPQPVWAKCAVCSIDKPTTIEIQVDENVTQRLCSEPCLAAYKFVNSVFPDQCNWCKKFFERKSSNYFTIYDGATPHCFCTKSCLNVYISNSRHIVPCNWCKVKKYNFDMIKKNVTNGQSVMMCSLNCLNLYQVSVNAVSFKRIQCDMCKTMSQAHYHLTMSDATVRNFCTYQCVMGFQAQYSMSTQLLPGEQAPAIESPKAFPTGAPTKTYSSATVYNKSNATKQQKRTSIGLPVISNVQSLATPPPLVPTSTHAHGTRGKSKRLAQQLPPPPEPEPPQAPKTPPPPPKPLTPPPPPPPVIYNHVLVKTLPPTEVSNKGTLTKPMMVSKGVSCRPHPCTKECQTDPSLERRVLIPIPVPIYVPVPCAMYSLPFPVPVPIPLPIPTPVFIPTTRNSAKGIMKEISKIHDKMPTDPFEAELLMMAEMVAGDKKKDQSDSETDDDNGPEEGFSPVPMDGNNAFGEDMLQMALKMATEYEEPAVDLESAMTANTITPSSHPGMPGLEGETMHHHHMMVLEQQRAVAALRASSAPRKRAPPAPTPPVTRSSRSSKRRRMESAPPPQPEPPREPAEKPDANMCLKYTFGVNAWKQWVMTKNAEIEKSTIRRKPFKSEILQLNSDELNYSLCLFVKEVRKPNGSEYAPDTIYYLVLGIQQYLFENGRIDNIFTDPYYEKFTDCLDEVARKFSVLYNDSQYIVTRVEEEHLWESKQLGAHSPHVLLSTLMFFNTKHFNLVTVDEHMQLSFSHIMKHWKRNPNQPGQAKLPGSRNVLLRFYPPQSALEANSRKKKVYEQQENEDNPLRCPVKLYEFYISKCPESVRTRNDVFYLQPERSCVPDSPVWYSTQPLSREALAKMLHRVKMVKEINIALLTS